MQCAARFLIVMRLARVVASDVPHHVTQHGNGPGFILALMMSQSCFRFEIGESMIANPHRLSPKSKSNRIQIGFIPEEGGREGSWPGDG